MNDKVYGITEQGFQIKTLNEIRESLKTRLQTLKDPDSGENLQVNWDEDDPLIQILNAFCDEISTVWQLAEQAYGQFNPMSSTGCSLSGLVQLNGITRKKGNPSTVMLQFAGEVGTFIPEGTMATDKDHLVNWATYEDVTIGENGTVIVLALSTTNGSYNFSQGTINELTSTASGISAVVNIEDTNPGDSDESDSALRIRRSKSTETPSRGIAESLYGAISNLDGVKYVKVFCNRTSDVDINGIPGKSVACVVHSTLTGTKLKDLYRQVAQQIFWRTSICCNYYGNQTVLVKDENVDVVSVKFQTPEPVPIYVNMTVSAIEGFELPENYAEKIRSNIIQYAEGGPSAIGIIGGFDDFGFPPAEDVAVSRLYTPVNAIQGVKVDSLEIGVVDGVYSTQDIPITWKQIAQFTGSNIVINGQDE